VLGGFSAGWYDAPSREAAAHSTGGGFNHNTGGVLSGARRGGGGGWFGPFGGLGEVAPQHSGPQWLQLLLLLLGRAASGGACGGYTLLLPVYLGELAPAHMRGALGAAMAAASAAGSTLIQVLGTRSLLGSAAAWPLLPLCSALCALAQLLLLCLPLAPETPEWLAAHRARLADVARRKAAEARDDAAAWPGGHGAGRGA